jgi:hypothetical protein
VEEELPGEPHHAPHALQLEGRPLGHPQVVPRRLGAARLRPELRHLYRRRRRAPRQEDPAVVEAVVAE